jgi:hypothetical protein
VRPFRGQGCSRNDKKVSGKIGKRGNSSRRRIFQFLGILAIPRPRLPFSRSGQKVRVNAVIRSRNRFLAGSRPRDERLPGRFDYSAQASGAKCGFSSSPVLPARFFRPGSSTRLLGKSHVGIGCLERTRSENAVAAPACAEKGTSGLPLPGFMRIEGLLKPYD